LKFEGTPVTYVNAPGAEEINVNGIVATSDGRYLIIGKRNENMLFRVDLKSREIVPVNMPAGMLNTPDGLFLQGKHALRSAECAQDHRGHKALI
jgi:hypothetical protein